MDRKEFLGSSIRLGFCCGAALMLERALSLPLEAGETGPSPCERTVQFAKMWVADFMAQMDAKLDQPTRERVMEANGRACYQGAHGTKEPPKPPVDVDQWIAGAQKAIGNDNVWRDGDAIHFRYVGNPRGLKIADGYCLCPVVEDGPSTLSPTYCHCSVGYVTEIFERGIGRKAAVTLVDSLRRGGKECHFRATLA
jgi:hypothetical protein